MTSGICFNKAISWVDRNRRLRNDRGKTYVAKYRRRLGDHFGDQIPQLILHNEL